MDAIAEVFLRFGRYANVNTNQIIVVAGEIVYERLAAAVRTVVPRFPLLLTRLGTKTGCGAWAPADVRVERREYPRPCDFDDPAFRRLLMDLSDASRLDCTRAPPLQLFLIVAADRRTSCVYLNSSHAVADAKSDCLLLAAIIRAYGAGSAPAAPYDYQWLPAILPRWYAGVAAAMRKAAAIGTIMRDLVRVDHGFAPSGLRRRAWSGRAAAEAALDFYHSVLPTDVERQMNAAAKRSGFTVNTLFGAALVRAMERVANVRTGHLKFTCAISLRRMLGPAHAQAFRNYMCACNLRVAAAQGTRMLLRDVQLQVQHARRARIPTELGRLEVTTPFLRIALIEPLVRRLMAGAIGTNVCYSNPGIVEEDFSCFGDPELRTRQYVGFGCLVPPYDLILYTPTVNGRLQLDAVYRRQAFTDFAGQFVLPYRDALAQLLSELAGGAVIAYPGARVPDAVAAGVH